MVGSNRILFVLESEMKVNEMVIVTVKLIFEHGVFLMAMLVLIMVLNSIVCV